MNDVNPNANSISKTLNGHHHRLVSLQVSLQDAYRSGTINRREFQARSRRVRKTLNKIRNLQNWYTSQKVQLTDEANLGLPNLEQCNPDEINLCRDFLTQRSQTLKSLLTEAREVENWVEKASRGETFTLWFTFQLSALRKRIGRLDQKLTTLKFHESELDDYADRVAKLFVTRNKTKSQQLRNNLEAMMQLFYQLDKTAARITQIKERVQIKLEKVEKMRTWLEDAETNFEQPIRFQPPPSPKQAHEACERAGLVSLHSFDNTTRRLTLAKEYVENCLREVEKAASQQPQPYTDPSNLVTIELPEIVSSQQVAFSKKQQKAKSRAKRRNKKRRR